MPKCPKDCKKHNPFIFRKVVIPAVVDDDTINPPANGAYCNAVVVYEATGNVYLYSSDGIPTSLSSTDYNLLSNLPSINGKVLRGDVALSDLGISQLVEEEAHIRATADEILQRQIDAITVASDVVDIVGTYEELEEYDTSKLKENDIIKVLSDETIGGATAYYRWVNGAWQYIGEEGPYYTKTQTDALLDQKMDITSLDNYYTKTETDTLLAAKASVSDLANKQDTLIAGSNITIDPTTNVISATVPSLTNYYTKSETYNQTEVDNLISGVRADIPTNTSDLLNDSGFLTSIPIASSSVLGGIKVGSGLSIAQDGTLSATGPSITVDSALSTTSTNPVENRVITNALNGKANISDIPTVPTNVSSFYNDAGYLTSTDVASNYYNKSETYTQAQVNALIPTKTSDLTNDGSDGTSTYVEASDLATVATSGSYNDLTDKPSIMTGLVEMSYGESNAWAKFIAAYQAKQIVYCRASSNSNPATGTQGRKAFMAYVNNADNPTEVEFQYVRSVSSKTSSQPVDQVFVYKLTSASGGTWTVQTRDMAPKLANGTNTTVSYSNGTYTVNATQPTVNNATLTIQKNGTNVQTFTANQATNATANITVPTKTSDITNDSDFVSDASYVHTDNNYTTADKDKLAGIAAGAEVNVQADWDESNSSSDAYIQNKPTIGNATLTVQKNGTTLDTFTANATTNKTINIPVPTKTSDLTNDSGYVVDDGDTTCADTDGGFAQITNPTSHNVAPLSLTHLFGNATQQTYTGKNLAEVVCRTSAMQGITATYNSDTGVITLSGTATTVYSTPFQPINVNIPAGTYTLKQYGTLSHGRIGVNLRRADNTQITEQLVNTSTLQNTFTLTEDAKIMQLLTGGHQANDSVSGNIQVLLVAGSTAGDFEPYVGAIPSPNPDYPQAVNTVTGRQVIKITGKNIFDKNSVSPINAYVASDGSIGYSTPDRLVVVPVRPNTTYTITAERIGQIPEQYTDDFAGAVFTSETPPAVGSVGRRVFWGAAATYPTLNQTFTTSATENWLAIKVANTQRSSYDGTLATIQLEINDQATPFEPYAATSAEINLGKNLLPITATSTIKNGTTFTFNPDGTITVSGTPSTQTDVGLSGVFSLTATGPMTLSNDGTMPTGSALVFKRTVGGTTTYPEALTPTSNTYAIAEGTIFETPLIRIKTTFTGTATFKFQLEAGTQASPYAPYKTPIELAKIDTYQDYIWNDDGTWYIRRAVGKVVLDGSSDENWGGINNNACFYTPSATDCAMVPTSTVGAIMSDYFTATTYGNLYGSSVDYGTALHPGSHYLLFRDKDITTVADFKTWLSTHNTTVYYALATPTDTEITDSELIEQLNHIYELYQGTNNLWLIPSAGAQGEMTLCASLSQLPVATTQRLGAVIVGDGLGISESGVLSATGIAVDSALSAVSTNPVQNKTIYAAIGDVESILNTLNIGAGV